MKLIKSRQTHKFEFSVLGFVGGRKTGEHREKHLNKGRLLETQQTGLTQDGRS